MRQRRTIFAKNDIAISAPRRDQRVAITHRPVPHHRGNGGRASCLSPCLRLEGLRHHDVEHAGLCGRGMARRDALSRGVLAVAEFVQVAEKRYRSGGEQELRSWLATALNELLQHNDRVELMAILLGHAFDTSQKTRT